MTLSVGILIGGQGSRLGGVAKGLLVSRDDVTIIERLLSQVALAAPHARVFLLGARSEYAHLHLPQLNDDPPNIGPLGGLNALLNTACDEALLLACDMPFVTATLMVRLLGMPCPRAVASKGDSTHFEPLFSRFNVHATRPVVRRSIALQRYSLQGVLAAVGADVMPLSREEAIQLRDWDTPEDVSAG